MLSNSELKEDDFAFVYLDVDQLPIAWLAYRGVINSCDVKTANPSNLSFFLMDIVQRGMDAALRREGVLEAMRVRHYSSRLSRLKCVYAWPSLEMAARGCYGRGKFHEKNLVAIAPMDRNYKRDEHDSNWITDFDSLPAVGTAKRYWDGEQTATPLTECLLSGRFLILGTKVRERAYDTIKKANPNSLAMLELSRLAVEFQSDLGSIAPWIKRDDETLFASFVMRYAEIEGLQVFAQAIKKWQADNSFPINFEALKPLTSPEKSAELDAQFAVPDLRPFERTFRIDKFSKLGEFTRRVINGEMT
jgi:hypothetical protein